MEHQAGDKEARSTGVSQSPIAAHNADDTLPMEGFGEEGYDIARVEQVYKYEKAALDILPVRMTDLP